MTTSRGITDTRVYDREGVIDRYGIAPELVPDFIGLKGDTSDNIPGVPGIGDKTAAELLQRFGSLEQVLEHVDEISGAKRKQNLIEHAEAARISKQLATAQREIPLELDVAEFVSAPPDRSRLREVFREFELREPLRRLEEALGSADAAAPAPVAEQASGGSRRVQALWPTSRGFPATPKWRSRCARPRRRRGPCSARTRNGASASTSTPRARWWWADARDRRTWWPRLDRGRRSRMTPSPWARCPRRWPTTRRLPPTCSSRPAAPTRSASCARNEGSRPAIEDEAGV